MRYVGMAGSGLLIISAVGLLVAVVPVFGNKALIVRSGSMQPAIGVGDLVVVRESAEYAVGDVMAFESATSKDTVITHRVTEIQGEGESLAYITKGDANGAVDEAVVAADRVLGRGICSSVLGPDDGTRKLLPWASRTIWPSGVSRSTSKRGWSAAL